MEQKRKQMLGHLPLTLIEERASGPGREKTILSWLQGGQKVWVFGILLKSGNVGKVFLMEQEERHDPGMRLELLGRQDAKKTDLAGTEHQLKRH